MFDNFESYMVGLMSFYNNSMFNMVQSLTDDLFNMLDKSESKFSVLAVNDLKKLIPGRFYLIQYEYNGNKIWCPIFPLEYQIKEKHIVYAINLEYLMPTYKIKFFNMIFKQQETLLTKVTNRKVNYIFDENPLTVNFKMIYDKLKSNGNMTFAVTAYNYMKIKKLYIISFKNIPYILMCDPKKYNRSSMKELFDVTEDKKFKDAQDKILKEYDKIIKEYNMDSVEYHKMLAAFEQKMKLFK